MTAADRQIWIATFAAAYVAAVNRMTKRDVELCEDIAADAASLASEALAALRDARRTGAGNGRLSLAAARDIDHVLTTAERAAVYLEVAAKLRATGERGSEVAALLVEQLADDLTTEQSHVV
jgi:hypothetical protein